MNPSDIQITFQWWLTIFILGIGFLPLTFFFFKNFFDRGYIFSKIFGLTISSYMIFTLGLFHLIPFSRIGSIGIFLAIVACLFFLLRKRESIAGILKQSWKIFLFEEILFFGAIFFWAYIHSFSPDIHGLEKYMDFGFINSILRADYFPPKDMWFTPLPINYYYFGHLMTAVLTQASGISSSFTFNLMLATIFAFCLTESFSIGANLFNFFFTKSRYLSFKRSIAGIISACLVTLAGNLHIVYAFFKAYPNESPVPIWQLVFLPFSFPNAYWYPNATRFIYHTIHEFPIYSWVVADLHGHVLDIPVVLLTIAVLLSLFMNSQIIKGKSQIHSKKQTSNNFIGTWKLLGPRSFSEIGGFNFLVPISFLLAIMYMTNAWDGGIYLLLTMLILGYFYWKKEIGNKKFFSSVIIVIVGFVLFVLPFNINFKASSLVSGIGVLCSPEFLVNFGKLGPFLFEADHCQHSPWWQLLSLYGFFYFFVFSFLIFLWKQKKVFLSDHFVLILILLGTILILLPEFFYMKDIYPAHYRANTMFKLVFQAFILLSLASGYIIVRIVSSVRKSVAIGYLPFAAVLVSLVMLYPYLAINSYYGNLLHYSSLRGTTYLNTSYPDDAAAISWLNSNVKGQPVILEAQGDSYTDYARVSANTGLPTVLGWTVHEWLWRGTYNIPAPRIEEVKKIYESKNKEQTKELLEKYNVQYIFIGTLEYQKYPALQEDKFKQLGKIVFRENNTKIYQINSL